jgi:hypothetical protein
MQRDVEPPTAIGCVAIHPVGGWAAVAAVSLHPSRRVDRQPACTGAGSLIQLLARCRIARGVAHGGVAEKPTRLGVVARLNAAAGQA